MLPSSPRRRLTQRVSRAWASFRQTVRLVWQRLRAGTLTPRVVAFSVAVGLAVGMVPLYGMHGVLVLAVCLPLRLDSPLAFAATMISNPVTFPLLVALELKVGETLLGNAPVSLERLMQGDGWADAAWQLTVGTSALSLFSGLVGAALAWAFTLIWRRWRKRRLAQ